jgi:uncharacterized membrane protein YoaK (UPF0700 family)
MTEPVGVPGNQANHSRRVGVETRGLLLAGLLSALAGMVDAIGYLHLSGLFISFMSGNSTQLAAALGQGQLGEAGTIAELIALFVFGAAAGQMLADFTGRRHMTWVLVGVAILLAIAAALGTAAEPMVFAMGALNAAMRRAGSIPISLTFVTGVLVRFGQGFGDFLTRRVTGWNWLAQGTPWLGLIVGATISSGVYMRIGEAAIWVPIGIAALLAAYSVAIPQPD